MTDATDNAIRQILREHAKLSADPDTLADDSDLFVAGMTSHASITVMLALEDQFCIEFPDEMLTRAVFQTIGALSSAVGTLQSQAA